MPSSSTATKTELSGRVIHAMKISGVDVPPDSCPDDARILPAGLRRGAQKGARARLGSEYPRARQPSRYQGGPPESHQLLSGSFRRGEEGGRHRQVPGCGKERDQAAEIRILDELRSLSAGQYRE